MKITQRTYQRFIKAVAALLLVALFVPTGLHAKQLVEFCNPAPIEQPMAADHSCCDEPFETNEHENSDAHQNHNCDWGNICACNVSLSDLNNTEWIVTDNSFAITVTATETLSLLIPQSESIHTNQQFRIGHFKPPLWLLYDTYLI